MSLLYCVICSCEIDNPRRYASIAKVVIYGVSVCDEHAGIVVENAGDIPTIVAKLNPKKIDDIRNDSMKKKADADVDASTEAETDETDETNETDEVVEN